MTNDEKRDRKLRETFEQCLSGIDTLPSQRAEITRKLSEAPAHTGRIAFRAIALPVALTLLLCAGIGVFSGLQGSQPYPDPLKTDATLVAEKPLPTDFVPLAQPEGEGGTDTVVLEGNSVTWDQWGAVVPTVEPEPEANVQAVWFFSRWRDHKWADLLEMCSQEWRDRQPDPAAALADLTGFMTPDTLEFDAITGIKETEDAGYIMYVTVSDIEKPETQYMISLNVKKENGGLWYINPDSLKDYTVLAPRHLPETAEEEIPEETAEARIIPYANTRLLKCIQLWRAENWQGLLDLCVPAWKEQAADPLDTLKNLFPFDMPEIVDSTPLKSNETEYTTDCILRSRSNRGTWYHAAVSMQKEADGLWYLNPESLRDCKAMTAEEILKFRIARADSRRDYYFPSADAGTVTSSDPMSFIKSNHPSLADSLVPLGLTCESDGIRLEIISAAIQEEGSLILYSLKDLTGDRVGRHEEYAPWLHISGVDYPIDGWTVSYLEQNAAEHYASYAMYIPGDHLYNIEGNLNCSLSRDLLFYSSKEVDLMPLLRKYEDRTWKLVDLPENAIPFPDYPEYRKYAKEMDIKVLDNTDSLDIPLAENVTLDGIGYPEDGRLHIRMHVINNGKLADSSGCEYRPIFNVSAWKPFEEYNPSEEVSVIEWATDEDGAESWVEYAYRCTRESLNREGLRAAVYFTDSYAQGPWEIEVQTDSVRK